MKQTIILNKAEVSRRHVDNIDKYLCLTLNFFNINYS